MIIVWYVDTKKLVRFFNFKRFIDILLSIFGSKYYATTLAYSNQLIVDKTLLPKWLEIE